MTWMSLQEQKCYIEGVAVPPSTISPEILAKALYASSGRRLFPDQEDWDRESAELLRQVMESEHLNALFQRMLDTLSEPLPEVTPWRAKPRSIRVRALRPDEEHNQFLYEDRPMGAEMPRQTRPRLLPTAFHPPHLGHSEYLEMLQALRSGWYNGLASPRAIGFEHDAALEVPAISDLVALIDCTKALRDRYEAVRTHGLNDRFHAFFHPHDDWVVITRPVALNCSLVVAQRGSEKIQITSMISGEHIYWRVLHNAKKSHHHFVLDNLEKSTREIRKFLDSSGYAGYATLDRALSFHCTRTAINPLDFELQAEDPFDHEVYRSD